MQGRGGRAPREVLVHAEGAERGGGSPPSPCSAATSQCRVAACGAKRRVRLVHPGAPQLAGEVWGVGLCSECRAWIGKGGRGGALRASSAAHLGAGLETSSTARMGRGGRVRGARERAGSGRSRWATPPDPVCQLATSVAGPLFRQLGLHVLHLFVLFA